MQSVVLSLTRLHCSGVALESPSPGSAVRLEQPSDIGNRAEAHAPVAPRSNGPWIGIAVGALALVAITVGWVVSGGGAPAATVVAPPTSVAAPPTSVAVVPDPPPTTVAAVAAAEVRVRISVVPTDATITIDGVEFPNPMDAMQLRQLRPVRIGVECDGYRSLDRLAIFDSDQNFHFELARGRGVQRVGVSGDELPEGAPHPSTTAPPPPSSGHGGGSFRDQF